MPVNLHPKALQAARTELAQGLTHVQVRNGKYIEGFLVFLAAYKANEALPQNGRVHDDLIEYVDEYPLIHFTTEFLRRGLSDTREYEKEPERKPLSEIAGYDDLAGLAGKILDSFKALPYTFTFSIPFSSSLVPLELIEGTQIPIGPDCRITKPDLLMSEGFPLAHDNPKVEERIRGVGLLSLIGSLAWDGEGAYYQRTAQGFVGIYGGGSTTASVERDLESFLGLGLATRLFSYHYKYENPERIPEWVIHRRVEDNWEIDSKFKINVSIYSVLRHMVSFRFGSDYPEENRMPWLRGMLWQVNSVFAAAGNENLLLASKWFFDSFKEGDEALSYVRMMTTLEILLGEHADTSRASLGEILGNRLAYLIGKSHKDRGQVLSDFKRVYGVRSGILHHGKHRLRGVEREYISKLRTYCERAIQAEAELLLA